MIASVAPSLACSIRELADQPSWRQSSTHPAPCSSRELRQFALTGRSEYVAECSGRRSTTTHPGAVQWHSGEDPYLDILRRPTSWSGWRAPLQKPTKPRKWSAKPADEGLGRVADLTPTVVVMNVHTPGLDVAGAS
jgi:hypothetical protein